MVALIELWMLFKIDIQSCLNLYICEAAFRCNETALFKLDFNELNFLQVL
jgi:hypothetical protein